MKTVTHTDDRRKLISIPYKDGEIKIIIAKKECTLGNHYHKIKTEKFTLLEGQCGVVVNDRFLWMESGESIVISPYEKHSFALSKDSILFCICSHPYNSKDDYED